jgi:hypothetical protein
MSRAGDDRGVLAVRDLFGDDLPLEKSVYYNVALSITRLMIYDRTFATTQTEDVDALLAVPFDDYDRSLTWVNGFAGLVRAATVEKVPSDMIVSMMSDMKAVDPKAISRMLATLCGLYGGSAPDGVRPNAFAQENAAQLIDAAGRADKAVAPLGADRDTICWGYGGYMLDDVGGDVPQLRPDAPRPTGVLPAPQPEGSGADQP